MVGNVVAEPNRRRCGASDDGGTRSVRQGQGWRNDLNSPNEVRWTTLSGRASARPGKTVGTLAFRKACPAKTNRSGTRRVAKYRRKKTPFPSRTFSATSRAGKTVSTWSWPS
jgi:hypothetical protein